MTHTKEIGERIREIRKQLKLSQKELGDKMNLSAGSLSEIETGKYNPSMDFVIKLAKNHNVNLYYLLLGEREMFVDPGLSLFGSIERFAVNIDDVKEFLYYFQRSPIIQYHILTQFKAKMITDKDVIEKDIEKAGI